MKPAPLHSKPRLDKSGGYAVGERRDIDRSQLELEMDDMNDQELILAELRKISAWADFQRRSSKWSLVVLVVFLLGAIMFGPRAVDFWFDQATKREDRWYDVESNVELGDFDNAIRIGEEFVQKTPLHPEAHQRLAGAYLAAGKLPQAREHYAEAFRLFPSEQNEKLVRAIDKRIQAEISGPGDPANAGE